LAAPICAPDKRRPTQTNFARSKLDYYLLGGGGGGGQSGALGSSEWLGRADAPATWPKGGEPLIDGL